MTTPAPRIRAVELPVPRPFRPRRALTDLARVRKASRPWRLARLAVWRRAGRAGAFLRSPAARRWRRVVAHLLRAVLVVWCLPWVLVVLVPAAASPFCATPRGSSSACARGAA